MPLFGPPNVDKLKAKKNIKGLIKALGYPKEPRVRRAAAVALGQLGDARAAEALAAALEDGPMRLAAANALARLGDARAVSPLVTALAGRDATERRAAAESLKRLSWVPGDDESRARYLIGLGEARSCVEIGKPAVEPLLADLADEWQVSTIEALGEIGDTRAVGPITTLLDTLLDPNTRRRRPELAKAAVKALGQIGGARAVLPLIAIVRQRGSLAAELPGEAWTALAISGNTAALSTLLNDRDASVRARAAATLGESALQPKNATRRAHSVEALIAALHDESGTVRRAAADALDRLGWQPGKDAEGAAYYIAREQPERCIEIGEPAMAPLMAELKRVAHSAKLMAAPAAALEGIGAPAVEPLAGALAGAEATVRRQAAEVLGKIGDARAVAQLIDALAGGETTVRLAAAEALGKIGDARAVGPLTSALQGKDGWVREAAAKALGQIGDAAALPALIDALADPAVREEAARALSKLGWEPDDSAVAAAYWVILREWERCVEIGAPAVAPLVAALRDDTWPVRQAAARSLGLIGESQAVRPLLAVLKDQQADVRQAAAEALGRIGDARAVKALAAAIEDDEGSVRKAASEALVRIGDAGAVTPLVALLQNSAWAKRECAAKTLVALYRSGELDQEALRRILAKRAAIAGVHTDDLEVTGHGDIDRSGQPSDCSHVDGNSYRHTDSGIGVEFPV